MPLPESNQDWVARSLLPIGLQRSHDWLDTTVTIPARGGPITLHREDTLG